MPNPWIQKIKECAKEYQKEKASKTKSKASKTKSKASNTKLTAREREKVNNLDQVLEKIKNVKKKKKAMQDARIAKIMNAKS
jgi:putative lipoic acid-binding regulatory protein